MLKGEIQLRQGKLDDSIQTLQNVIRAAPENAFAHYQMGLALEQKGKTQEAQNELREAVRYSPALYEAWRALGESAIQRADWQGLHNIALELKKTAPRAPEGYLFDATARMNQNDATSAESDLDKLITIAPDRALGYVKLGQLRVIQKKLDDAEKLFRQGLSHEPDSLEAAGIDGRRLSKEQARRWLTPGADSDRSTPQRRKALRIARGSADQK